jgi:putative transposase
LKVLANGLIENYRVSQRRACSTVMLHRSGFYYEHHKREDRAIRKRIREVAEVRVRYGFWRVYILLKREGWKDNHKRMYRIYKEEGLNLRSKRPRRSKSAAHRLERPDINGLYQCCSMDFVSDQLFDGRKFRALTLVDNFSRECLAIQVGQSLKGTDVVALMDGLKNNHGIIPKRIQVDNGSEFISKEFDRWAYENNVTLDFSRPGKPTDNPFIESFNGSFRDECLNVNWFLSMEDAMEKIQAFKDEYNQFRPHSSLGGLTPSEVVEKSKKDPEFSTLSLS